LFCFWSGADEPLHSAVQIQGNNLRAPLTGLMRLGLEHDGARWNTTTSLLLLLLLLRCPALPFYYGNGQHGTIPLSLYLLSSPLPPSPSLPFLSSTHTTCSSASLPLGINSTYAYLMCQSIQICRCLGTVCKFYNAAVRFLPPFPTQKPPLAGSSC
jgi:hypothetical protein